MKSFPQGDSRWEMSLTKSKLLIVSPATCRWGLSLGKKLIINRGFLAGLLVDLGGAIGLLAGNGELVRTSNEPTQATRKEFEEFISQCQRGAARLYHVTLNLDFMGKDYLFKVKDQHPVEGRSLEEFDIKLSRFCKEPRNVQTRGCVQMVSIRSANLVRRNSKWPDIDVYLRPLIEDLQVLWDKKGVETTDIVSGQNACPTCNEETPSIGVKNKIAYVGHRRFLRKPHKWRSSREFNGDTDHRDPPKEYPRDVILAQHARLLTRVPDSDVEDLFNDDDGDREVYSKCSTEQIAGTWLVRIHHVPPPTSFGCGLPSQPSEKPNLGGVKSRQEDPGNDPEPSIKIAEAANKCRPTISVSKDRADNTVVPTGPYATQWGNTSGDD
ncbi:hypothetical protein Tco_1393741 [Tanacetum coccineum]